MKEVYLLEWCVMYECPALVGVFTEKKLALNVMQEHPSPDRGYWWYKIRKVTLGEVQPDFLEEYKSLIRAREEVQND